MSIYFNFSNGWWVIVGLLAVIWLGLWIYRRVFSLKELKQQIITGLITVALTIVIETIAISIDLWDYSTGNWPAVLWLAYFIVGLGAYQVIKLVIGQEKK